jgi:two-component system sensor histidine kinase KdpD
LAAAAREVQVKAAIEKLQTALINSVSHDLHTPLASIIGVLGSLQDETVKLNATTRKNLIDLARQEAERLNRLVSNLLDVSRIEAGALRLSRQPSDITDVINGAIEQLGGALRGSREVKINVPPDVPPVDIDAGLMVVCIKNVLDNAVKYSPPDSPIEVNVRLRRENMEMEISDRGIGIPFDDLTKVFDKFYRVQRPDNVPGTGLGLSICKGIVEAHGGRIVAENRPGGGTTIRIVIPLSAPEEAGASGSK